MHLQVETSNWGFYNQYIVLPLWINKINQEYCSTSTHKEIHSILSISLSDNDDNFNLKKSYAISSLEGYINTRKKDLSHYFSFYKQVSSSVHSRNNKLAAAEILKNAIKHSTTTPIEVILTNEQLSCLKDNRLGKTFKQILSVIKINVKQPIVDDRLTADNIEDVNEARSPVTV